MKIPLAIWLLPAMNIIVAQPVHITVVANGYARNKTVVEVTLQKPLISKDAYELQNVKNKFTAPVQQINAKKIMFILPDVLQPGDSATYLLTKVRHQPVNPITVENQPTGLLVKVYGKKVLFYNEVLILPPDTLPALYARSGFIHPLYSPAGKILTDDFPVGHAHQHGIFMAWPNTEFKGQPHDFWNQQQKTGSVKHMKLESVERGPITTTIKLRLEHYSLTYGPVLSERWTLTIYPFHSYFLFDLRSDQQNTTADTLYIKQYHYGSMAFRGSRQWNDADSLHYKTKWNIVTDSGATLSNADGRRAAYVSASGLIDGAMAGVTVFGFPANDHYPQPIRVHPQMPYWGFAPAATGPFTINPGQVYTAQYRYFVADGSPDTKQVQEINNDLLHPPQVSICYK